MLLDKLEKKKLISPPPFVVSNCIYLTIMGSHAYGVADTKVKDKTPDYDVYGVCIPYKDMIFPHLRGEIAGFGTPGPRFDQFQKHHILDTDENREWDFNIFNIVKYFELCRQGNPNMIDTLFTHETCVLHITQVGKLIRDNRKLFISKEIWSKFRGYAFSQLHKMESKNAEGGRLEIINKHGYDVKFGYHLLRLLDEAQQLIETGEMDLMRAREAMKSIRRGEWKKEDIIEWARNKEKELDVAFTNCKLPNKADEEKLKELLLKCLEEHYGSMEKCITLQNEHENKLREIANLVRNYI